MNKSDMELNVLKTRSHEDGFTTGQGPTLRFHVEFRGARYISISVDEHLAASYTNCFGVNRRLPGFDSYPYIHHEHPAAYD